MMAFHQPGDVLDAGPDPPQQVPAYHAQAVVAGMGGEYGTHECLPDTLRIETLFPSSVLNWQIGNWLRSNHL